MKIKILASFIVILVLSILACGVPQTPTPPEPVDTIIAQTKTSAAGELAAIVGTQVAQTKTSAAGMDSASVAGGPVPSVESNTADLWLPQFTFAQPFPPDFWSIGTHTYHFFYQGPDGEENFYETTFEVSESAPLYPGIVYLRGRKLSQSTMGDDEFFEIHPEQETIPVSTWTGSSLVDAQAFLDSRTISFCWDNEPCQVLEEQLVESIPDESACTDSAELITETIPDGTVFASAINFTKTWVIKNNGTCTWTTDYTFVYTAGEVMGADNSVSLPYYVEPDQSLELELDLVSPIPSGEYTSQWMFKNNSGETFGWGGQADQAFWLTIKVDEEEMAVPNPGNISLDESSLNPGDTSNPDGTSFYFSFNIPPSGEIPQPIDTDKDGLTDTWEETIANFFLPILYFDGDESATRDEIMRFYQVTPLSNNEVDLYEHPGYHFEEYQGPSGVLVTYVIAYVEDYSFPLDPFDIGSHHGDTETIRMLLVHPRGDSNALIPAVLMIHRHGGNPAMYYWDEWWNPGLRSSDPNVVAAANESRFIHSGGHPIVWVSEDKHAMYATYEECINEYPIIGEDCGEAWKLDDPIVDGVNGFNVGERREHPDTLTMVPSNSMGLFTNEWIWSSPPQSIVEYIKVYPPICESCPSTTFPDIRDAADSFCGGSDWNQTGKCGGGLNGKWWPSPNPDSQANWGRLLTEYSSIFYRMNYGPDYQVCFYTGDLNKSGTDLHVDVTFTGTVGSGTWYDLDDSNQNFENGDVDCFDLSAPDFYETIRGLTLYLYNDSDDDSEWYLEKVTVYEYDSGGTITYPVNAWIDRKAGYDSTISENTTGPYIYLMPSP